MTGQTPAIERKGPNMLSKKMLDALNEQINAEMYSSYLYLSMATHFEDDNLKGFANWMHKQAKEEWAHAMRFYEYINDRMGRVTLKGIDTPPNSWASPVALFEEVCKHEAHVTALINNLVNMALDEKDHATNAMLQWFVTEQVEEEASAGEVLDTLKKIKDSPNGLFMLDHKLGQRE